MNVQIFGKKKCFETKKVERYFKERGVKVQRIDIMDKGLSKGEFNSVASCLGGFENLINTDHKDYSEIEFLSKDSKLTTLLEEPKFFKTPIVRNGKKAVIGFKPEIFKTWE